MFPLIKGFGSRRGVSGMLSEARLRCSLRRSRFGYEWFLGDTFLVTAFSNFDTVNSLFRTVDCSRVCTLVH